MKKLVMTLLTVLTYGSAYALPIGNPSEASLLTDGLFWKGCYPDFCDPCASWCDAFSLRAGFYGDYVFNRHMEISSNDVDSEGSEIEHTEIFTNAGYLALNMWNRADIFASLGTTNLSIHSNAVSFGGLAGERLELETQTDFSWSVGGRIILWECGCTTLGLEGQYFRARPDLKRITYASTESFYLDNTTRLKYHEWQVGLGISHRINMLIPYIAVKWSQLRANFDPDSVISALLSTGDLNALGSDFVSGLGQALDPMLPNLRNRKDWGYAVGVSLVDYDIASVTVEGRFADEKALYINGQLRF